MSSLTAAEGGVSTASNLPPAPWKSKFLSHLAKLSSPTFVLSTVARVPAADSVSSSASSSFSYVPRARNVVFRGFWSELPENKLNTAERNPRAYESELPTITTDVRMQKVEQLFSSASTEEEKGKQGNDNNSQGTGGGGPVEAVWWVEEAGAQWRIKGRAYVVSLEDIEKGEEENGNAGRVKSEIRRRMRLVDGDKAREWSWRREVEALFGNHSPALRGSFRAPPPGQSVSLPFNASELVLGQKVQSNDDPVALRHFRVVIIVPDSVEHTDLSDPDKARRWLYTFEGGEWKTEELWP